MRQKPSQSYHEYGSYLLKSKHNVTDAKK